MKKARIVLALVLTLGIAGGLFAFKAKSNSIGTLYYTTAVSGANARVAVPHAATTTVGVTVYYTFQFNQPALNASPVQSVI